MTTTEEFKDEVDKATKGKWSLSRDSKYTRATDKVFFVHNKCGNKLVATPKRFRQLGLHCKICKDRFINTDRRPSRRKGKTTEQFKQELLKQLGPDYKLLTPYVNSRVKVRVKHEICGKEFEAYPGNLLKEKYGCPHCSAVKGRNKQLSSCDVFKNRVQQAVGKEYTFLDPYRGSLVKLRVRHNKCGHIYLTTPNNFINHGRRCPFCYLDDKKTTKQVKEEIKNRFGNEFELESEYKNAKSKVQIKHNKCGHRFWVLFNSFIVRGTCPYCKQSRGEHLIQSVLTQAFRLKPGKDFNYGYVLPNKLHLDFYLPKYKLAIEYDGKQHQEPVSYFGGVEQFKKQQFRDSIKNTYCNDHDINLVRIPYTVISFSKVKQIISAYINY